MIELMEDALAGHIVPCEYPSFWGQSVPLTKEHYDAVADAPAMFANADKVRPPRKRVMLRKGRNFLNIDPNNLYEKKD